MAYRHKDSSGPSLGKLATFGASGHTLRHSLTPFVLSAVFVFCMRPATASHVEACTLRGIFRDICCAVGQWSCVGKPLCKQLLMTDLFVFASVWQCF